VDRDVTLVVQRHLVGEQLDPRVVPDRDEQTRESEFGLLARADVPQPEA